MPISYHLGDVSGVLPAGKKCVVCHVCNDIGRWRKGFMAALSEHSHRPETSYRSWYSQRHDRRTAYPPFRLGEVYFARHGWATINVANMIAQHGLRGSPAVQYDALEKCFEKVSVWMEQVNNVIVVVPRYGLGDAEWDKVEPIVQKTLSKWEVNVYDLEIKT